VSLLLRILDMSQDDVDVVLKAVKEEFYRSMVKHGPMKSPHDGWAVLLEELDELWEHVRGNTARTPEAQKEAIQLAAMAVKFVLLPERVPGW